MWLYQHLNKIYLVNFAAISRVTEYSAEWQSVTPLFSPRLLSVVTYTVFKASKTPIKLFQLTYFNVYVVRLKKAVE